MSESEALWKILRCPKCEGLMKVGRQQESAQLACPSCGTMLGDGDGGPGTPELPEVVEPAEVITREAVDPRPGAGVSLDGAGESDDLDASELAGESGPAAEPPSALRPTASAGETIIPSPRREEYRVPEMISNVGERIWNPGVSGERKAPKFDKSRIGSTSDERLAADPEEEEGAVQAHVARKITGWDLDDDEEATSPEAGESAGTQLKSRLAMAGIVAVVTLFVVLIIYGLIQSLREKEVVAREEEKSVEDMARESLSGVERDVLDRSEETFTAAGAAIEAFLNADSYRDRLEFVRDAARVEPLMEDYYAGAADGPIEFREPEGGWKMQPYDSFLLTTVVAQNFDQLPIAVERQEDGRYLIDWESFVGYCEIPWDEVTERKSTEPFLLRARATPADYYNFGFDDPKEWACVLLQDNGQKRTIYGYVRFDDPVFQELTEVMSMRGPVHLTVKVAYPPEGKALNQFLITEFVSKGWVFSKDGDGEDDDDAGASAGGE